MKPLTLLFTALSLILGLAACADTPPKPEKVFWGKAVNGVQAGLSLEGGNATLSQGQHITFKFLLRNVGKKPVTLDTEGYGDPFHWSAITQERNHRISITRSVLLVSGIHPEPITLTLAPGETQALTGPSPTFLLATMRNSTYTEPVLVITHSGAYSIQAAPLFPRIEGRDNWVQKLVTGVIPLKVLAAPSSTVPSSTSTVPKTGNR